MLVLSISSEFTALQRKKNPHIYAYIFPCHVSSGGLNFCSDTESGRGFVRRKENTSTKDTRSRKLAWIYLETSEVMQGKANFSIAGLLGLDVAAVGGGGNPHTANGRNVAIANSDRQ